MILGRVNELISKKEGKGTSPLRQEHTPEDNEVTRIVLSLRDSLCALPRCPVVLVGEDGSCAE